MPITTPHLAMSDLQAAVTTALLANSTVTSLVTGIFDPAPTNQPFPYVTFGPHIESNWYQFQNTGRQVLFWMDIWSQQKAFDEAYSIADAIAGAQEVQTLTLTHFTMAQNGFLFETATKQDDPDGVTRHLIAKYRIYLIAK